MTFQSIVARRRKPPDVEIVVVEEKPRGPEHWSVSSYPNNDPAMVARAEAAEAAREARDAAQAAPVPLKPARRGRTPK